MVTEKNIRSKEKKVRKFSRRDFIKAAGAGLAVAGLGAGIMLPGRALAGKRKLRIVQWAHPGGSKIFMPRSGGRKTTPRSLWKIIHDARITSRSARPMLRRGTICSCSAGHQQFLKIT